MTDVSSIQVIHLFSILLPVCFNKFSVQFLICYIINFFNVTMFIVVLFIIQMYRDGREAALTYTSDL